MSLKCHRSVLIGTRLPSLGAAFAGEAFWHEPGLADQEAAPDPHPSAMVQSESTCHSSFLRNPLHHFTVQLRALTFMRLEILTYALDTEDHGGEKGTGREMEEAADRVGAATEQCPAAAGALCSPDSCHFCNKQDKKVFGAGEC